MSEKLFRCWLGPTLPEKTWKHSRSDVVSVIDSRWARASRIFLDSVSLVVICSTAGMAAVTARSQSCKINVYLYCLTAQVFEAIMVENRSRLEVSIGLAMQMIKLVTPEGYMEIFGKVGMADTGNDSPSIQRIPIRAGWLANDYQGYGLE